MGRGDGLDGSGQLEALWKLLPHLPTFHSCPWPHTVASIPGGRLGIGNVTSESRLGSGLGLTLSSPLGILVLASQPHLHPVSSGHTWLPAHSLTSHEEEGAGQGQASIVTQERGHQICANAPPSPLADSLLSAPRDPPPSCCPWQ